MTQTNNINEIELLDKTAILKISKQFRVEKKGPDTLKVFLSKSDYPTLGINLDCFDNPKLNTTNLINNFLRDNLKINNQIIRNNNIFKLNYEVKIETERLMIWKVLHYLKPRSFRLLRFSLTWPDNPEAEKIVSPILVKIPFIIDEVKFSLSKTLYDSIASLEYNLNNAKFVEKKLWGIFKFKMPQKWTLEHKDEEDFAKVYMNSTKSFQFLIERFSINFNNAIEDPDKSVEKLIEEITREVLLSDAKLKKTENNNYLFYFLASENDIEKNRSIIQNKIWYRIKVLEKKIEIVSAIFELSSKHELENNLYVEKLDQIIQASEFLD